VYIFSPNVKWFIAFHLLFLYSGDFSEASVYLDFNHLTRFDSAVYEGLLEQMHRSMSQNAGLYVRNSKFLISYDIRHPCILINGKFYVQIDRSIRL
jgi:hypothetical protein